MKLSISSEFLFRPVESLLLWNALQTLLDIPVPTSSVLMRVARVKEQQVARTSLTVQDTCRVTKIRTPTARIISDCGTLFSDF
jgi:hypothetical protein